MGLASLTELYLDELSCLYDAEITVLRTLPRLGEATRTPQLRELLQRYCIESRMHLERLQLIFTHWGAPVSPRACIGMTGIVQEADERLSQAGSPGARDAAVIGAALRMGHYEIAAYGCVRSYALRLNRPDEARLLKETLNEDTRVDRRLSEIAAAAGGEDPPPRDAGEMGRYSLRC
jgi:Mn-containing catalase